MSTMPNFCDRTTGIRGHSLDGRVAMMKLMPRRALVMCVLAVSMLATGCAKRAMKAPPAPPPAPAQKEPTTPAPPPAETKPETPTPKALGSGDFEPAFFDFDSYALREDARTAL